MASVLARPANHKAPAHAYAQGDSSNGRSGFQCQSSILQERNLVNGYGQGSHKSQAERYPQQQEGRRASRLFEHPPTRRRSSLASYTQRTSSKTEQPQRRQPSLF